MKTIIYTVHGPYKVPCYEGRSARTITKDNARDFWMQYPDLATEQGCYVFGIRAGRGYTPGYVGKATKSFEQEVFSQHKLNKYHHFLSNFLRGTPILFFAVAPSNRGTLNLRRLNELEDFLIQVGVAANTELENIKGTKAPKWGIAGLIRGGFGKPSDSTRKFSQLMKIRR